MRIDSAAIPGDMLSSHYTEQLPYVLPWMAITVSYVDRRDEECTKRSLNYVACLSPFDWHYLLAYALKKTVFEHCLRFKSTDQLFGNWHCLVFFSIFRELVVVTCLLRHLSSTSVTIFPVLYTRTPVFSAYYIIFKSTVSTLCKIFGFLKLYVAVPLIFLRDTWNSVVL